MVQKKEIQIQGAHVNNLKHVDVTIPRNQLVVITGLSGSGKSSLAFDTLYAEGQRRYVESLSSYARQFLGRMSKPECDFIMGIPPAIAIEQKVISRNPRSTVGTQTEIYEHLRMLFARVGHTISPVTGNEVKKHTPEDVVDFVMTQSEGTKFTVLTKANRIPDRALKDQLIMDLSNGFSRIDIDGKLSLIEDFVSTDNPLNVYLMIDRLAVKYDADTRSRVNDSVQTAFYEGLGECAIRIYVSKTESVVYSFSNKFEADGMRFLEPSPQLFSFNNPYGACPKCEGFGKVMGIDENLVIPDPSLSVYDGAVFPWRGEKMGEWKTYFIQHAQKYDFPIFTPYYELTKEQKTILWNGADDLEGINAFFDFLQRQQYKIQYRVMLSRYRGKTICPECHGTRLRCEANYVKVGGKSISDLVDLPMDELQVFFDHLELSEHESIISERLLDEIRKRIGFMHDVGLTYLTLNRLSNTLSGGESQRINLASSLSSSLVGSLYILDEPSIGLHSKDTLKLIQVLRKLQDLGNTVVVVEHDEDIMRAADYIIDVGPGAGVHGGQIVYQGDMSKLTQNSTSHTVRYLMHEDKIPVPTVRRQWNSYIQVKGARANNLKGVDVKLPLHAMTVVTGVSGSGKSTLVHDIFYLGLRREMGEGGDRPGYYISMTGDVKMISKVEYIDQNPIGKSSRSNAATYLKIWDEIRKLYAAQPLAKQMGMSAKFFSFNSDGGRCEECKGEGVTHVEMQFMADLTLTCESCKGKRFKKDTLEVTFQGKSVYDLLEMSVEEASLFFSKYKQEKIVKSLQPLLDVGLGYIKLGQTSTTLSGGENQRVKLAYYLSLERASDTLFIFDEPTTGLHFHDIHVLLQAFDKLIDRGHTVLIIEHNLDVVKCADHIIDIGPDGGGKGGQVVAVGTPEEIVECEASYTGQFLKEKLN